MTKLALDEIRFVDGLRCVGCIDELAHALYPEDVSVKKTMTLSCEFEDDGSISADREVLRAQHSEDVWDRAAATVFRWTPLCSACGKKTDNEWKHWSSKGFPPKIMRAMVIPIPQSIHEQSVKWVDEMGRPGNSGEAK